MPIIAAVLVTGTSGTSQTVTVNFNVGNPGISISANPTVVWVNTGAAGLSTITIAGTNGFTGTVALTSSISPTTGLTCALTLASITLGPSQNSTLSCTGSPGAYLVTISETSGTLSHTVTVRYIIQDFIIFAIPSSVSVSPGTAGTTTILMNPVQGFNGSISLAATVAPGPTSVTGSGTSTLSCRGSAGTYAVTVTGTSGILSHSTAVSFIIGVQPSFGITASPSSMTLHPGPVRIFNYHNHPH